MGVKAMGVLCLIMFALVLSQEEAVDASRTMNYGAVIQSGGIPGCSSKNPQDCYHHREANPYQRGCEEETQCMREG